MREADPFIRVFNLAFPYDFLVIVPSTFRSTTIVDQHTAYLLLLLARLVPHSAAGLLHGETHLPIRRSISARLNTTRKMPFASAAECDRPKKIETLVN